MTTTYRKYIGVYTAGAGWTVEPSAAQASLPTAAELEVFGDLFATKLLLARTLNQLLKLKRQYPGGPLQQFIWVDPKQVVWFEPSVEEIVA